MKVICWKQQDTLEEIKASEVRKLEEVIWLKQILILKFQSLVAKDSLTGKPLKL